jgi:putative acetyltransferase
VAVRDAAVVGHIAFSPVTIDGKFCAWYGLGPLSVTPIHQRKGVGSRLVNTGPKLPEARSANGCVLLGEPNFYSRFGFVVKVSVSPDSLRNIFGPAVPV